MTGFVELEALRQDDEFVLQRCEYSNRPGSSSVLLLYPASARPAVQTLRKLEHEYSLRDQLDSAWAVRLLTLTQHRGNPALVLEDPGGETLDRLLAAPMEVNQFLRLAVALSTALSGLHKSGLIHKDLKPANVLVAPATAEARLMGFEIASPLAREHQPPEAPELIAGTLAYMAPEQTGRMNRSIDARSDLYALGVTFYEMITGSLPFTASDPMEWVHCHIARQAIPPHELSQNVPVPVSAIIMKLLAKTPEERYQTAAGLESDLRRCLAAWETRRDIDDFPLGEDDRPDRLLIPEKLYGREREIGTLLASFDRIVKSGTPELVLVSGYSGIGKSSVVNELHKALVPPRGLFASGKFDQYKRDIPYATLVQAFQSLLRSLLTKSDAELSKWRDALRQALDPNGRLIVDLVPELTLIIGDQAPVPELPLQDARRRFHMVFRSFINVFARPEHPLALFLDDLQWLDAATLDLIEDVLSQADVRHLMLIGAYRDNEVDASHPLMRKLEAIRQRGAIVHDIVLAPLAPEDVEQLIADMLRCEPDRAKPLAQLVEDKTSGNPFFAIRFIVSLVEEELLAFDYGEGRWSWDLNRICAKGYTDNVVDLMVGKLRRLPQESQSALQHLACLGHTADIAILAQVFGTSAEQLHADLWEAVRFELVERAADSYRFVHDRIQEAAYSLIPEESRAASHLRIGRLLAAHTLPEKREETIFEIVNQLNRATALITSPEEREQVAELNLIAGKRAKASSAYASALNYLTAGVALLPVESWECRHTLMFELTLNRAECEFLTGALTEAQERLSELSHRAINTVERAIVASLHIDVLTTLDQATRAMAVALEYLRHVGIDWPAHPTQEEAQREYDRIWSHLDGRAIESVIDLPLMSDPESLATVDVLTKAFAPALYTDAKLLALVLCRAINLSLDRGNCDATLLAYVTFGAIAGPLFGNYQAGYRFGRLGYELVERRGLKRFQARTYLNFSTAVLGWTSHVRSCPELVRRAFDTATRNGDLTCAAYCRTHLTAFLFFAGDPLSEVEREAEHGLMFAQKAQFGFIIDLITAQLVLIETLRGLTPRFGCFDGGQIEELRFEQHLSGNPALALAECWYWIRKLQARYVAGDYPVAMEASAKAQRLLSTLSGFFDEVDYHFYTALSRAASCDTLSPDLRKQHLEPLALHQRQLDIWAQDCPENFENRAALVGAEIARIEGRLLDAEQLYEKAIRSAHANGFVQIEGLAYEVAARFYAARGFNKMADSYVLEARYCYEHWGAEGKVKQLDRLYPHLMKERPTSTLASTILAPSEVLDLGTVIKVSQAVAGEMVLEKLIDRVLRAAIEQAGAERGLLILPRGDELQLAAEGTTSGNDVTVRLGDASTNGAMYPESIVRYVMRTQESVILEDASSRNPFSADVYIAQRRPRSILTLPLLNKGQLISILHLENNLTPHVFTPDRITVLKVLASQAAISLENTRLYRELEDRERRIRRLVDANIVGVFTWNLEGQILEANDAFLRMVGYDQGDLVSGRLRWTDLTPSEWLDRDERHWIPELKMSGSLQPFEKEYLRKDGSRVPVLIAGALFEEGGSEGVAFALDLSTRKRAEEALRRSEAYLAQGERLTHAGSWGLDILTGEPLHSSAEHTRLFGFDPEKGMPAFEEFLHRVHAEDQERVIETFQTLLRSGGDMDMLYRIAIPGGPVRYMHAIGHPVLKQSGPPTEYAGITIDITERKRAEDELKAAFEEIKKLKDELYRENLALRDEVDRTSMFEEIVGTSKALEAVLSRVAKVAPTDSTVFITGETGTGKELIARAVHKRSRRSDRAFVSVNCAALTPALISSELFGYEKGAFTGAEQTRLGRFELADGGTIFLNEVGEFPADTQVALLRVLQEREFERVGGTQSIKVNVRVIAATNRDLKAAVADGAFRQDLFYRLNVFPIEVPPLRERKEDVLLLVEYFVQLYANRAGKEIHAIDKKILDLLQAYDWPGNIRELQNVIERSVILSSREILFVDESWFAAEIPAQKRRAEGPQSLTRDRDPRSEREIIEAALAESRGRVSGPSGAAAKLGVPQSTLAYKIKALGISKGQFKFR
jgi:PAS domain S-box-containing protein